MQIKVLDIPRTRLIPYAVIACLVAGYLLWSIYGNRGQTPGQGFVTAPPAVKTEKETGPTLKVPLKIVPKKEVAKKYPGAHVDDPAVEVIDTAKIPAAPNGATAITSINTTTGEATTEVQLNKAPWFALERSNELGLGIGVTSHGGQAVSAHYRRDILRVKDVHLTGHVEALVPTNGTNAEGRAELQVNWRF